ncbi:MULTISPECIES: VirK/YbjX family protein [unclassified Erwinia]|uniref:VirK/YbjX family protein n=1 Tax=unclassified Erwinia TaxID=2622719 RepID=UPI000C18DB20|nr:MULTISPECIES: VirK/YbjX family protein [unclassified Erwinia]
MSENTSQMIHKESGLSLFYALVSGRLQPGGLWQQPLYRVKYLVRAFIYPRATMQLLSAIAASQVMQTMLPLQNTLPGKIHRPYLYLSLPVQARSEAIISHYDFASRLPLASLRTALLSSVPLTLTTFSGKNGEHFVVELVCSGRCEREGEANMFIKCNHTRLAMLTFAVINKPQRVLIIGGIQGAHRDTPHEVIRDATRACHGLFPKRLLLEVVQMLAAITGVTRIEAVSDRGHVFRSLRYRLSKKRLFHASYDEFWRAIYGQPVSRDLFSLPLCFPRKPLTEIVSKKRSEYRKRYDLLDAMQESFRHHVL